MKIGVKKLSKNQNYMINLLSLPVLEKNKKQKWRPFHLRLLPPLLKNKQLEERRDLMKSISTTS